MYRRPEPDQIGGGAREQSAHGVAEVTPESVDAEARRPPRGMGVVRDRREQRRVDHCRAESLQRRGDQPGRIRWSEHGQPDPDGLHDRSEEHTSELQSPYDLVCRLLLEKKKKKNTTKHKE